MILLRLILLTAAIVLMAATAFAIAMRLPYPFELEWLEGGTVVTVARLLDGEPIYVEPSIEFVPFAYPVFYYLASAAAALFFGPGFTAVRVVSVLATAVTTGAIFAIVRPVSGVLAACCACAVFLGAYEASDGWYDVGRIDGLYIALLALCWLAAVSARTYRGWIVAGGLAFLASITKQPALIAVGPLAVYLLVSDRRAALCFCGVAGALAIAFLLFMTAYTDGWYAYYVLQVPRLRLGVSLSTERLLSFWTADLLPFGIAFVTGAAALVRTREYRHLVLASGLVLSAWISRLEGGAWNNTLMPAHLTAAILLGLALRPGIAAPLIRHGLAVVQLAVLLYDPRPFIPTDGHRAAAAAFRSALQSAADPIWVLDHAYWATQAGMPEHAHGWALTDVIWADRGPTGRELEREIRRVIHARRFTTIILDDERFWFFEDIDDHYRLVDNVDSPRPLSGADRRPRHVFVAK